MKLKEMFISEVLKEIEDIRKATSVICFNCGETISESFLDHNFEGWEILKNKVCYCPRCKVKGGKENGL